MQSIIEKVNKLQELCINIPNPINIPQIVVVGSQSSGKSSILENIVGYEILPRGTGMVTRRPLMIQIVSTEGDTYCTFGHSLNRTYKIEEVKEEIERETERILERKNDISAIPIVLRIHKKNTLHITLIDLPGIIKVRAEGQPEGIVKKIEEIVRSYVQNNNTVILAVTPANTDIASSDGLMIAREADPSFDRTLCVLTKLDLMDPGTDLVNVLQGKIVRTKLGFIPVICRGELSLKEKVKIDEALAREEEYFKTHPSYIKNHKYCGIPYLITRLHNILHKSIVKSTPYLQDRISYLIGKIEKERTELGGCEVTDERQVLMQIIAEYTQEVERKVSGTPKPQAKYLSKEIVDGARISYTLDEVFYDSINKLELFDATDTEIDNVVHNTAGIFGGSNKSHVVKHFTSNGIDRVQPICLQVASKVSLEMQSIVEISLDTNKKINRFPRLKSEICRSTHSLLKERLHRCTAVIKEFLEWNAIYIRPVRHSMHPCPTRQTHTKEKKQHAHGSPDAFSAEKHTKTKDSEIRTEIEEIRESVMDQIDSLKRTVTEQIPKIVILEVVYKTMNQLQNRLIEDLYTLESISQLLQEEQETKDRRDALDKSLDALEEARRIANSL